MKIVVARTRIVCIFFTLILIGNTNRITTNVHAYTGKVEDQKVYEQDQFGSAEKVEFVILTDQNSKFVSFNHSTDLIVTALYDANRYYSKGATLSDNKNYVTCWIQWKSVPQGGYGFVTKGDKHKITVYADLEGLECANTIEFSSPIWTKTGTAETASINIGHAWAIYPEYSIETCDYFPFKITNMSSLNFTVKNLQFYYCQSPMDPLANLSFNSWMGHLYQGGEFNLASSGGSMSHNIKVHTLGYLPNIYGHYELWCQVGDTLLTECWFRHYDYGNVGPDHNWEFWPYDRFQDNFPSQEFNLESFVRADMARDINSIFDPIVNPGDSVVVSVRSFGTGIAENTSGPMVYLCVKATYIGDPGTPKPPIFGSSLEGSYGTYVSDDGTWTTIQCDSARIGAGDPVPGKYMVDLNDSLLTRGYLVEYYFEAFDSLGLSSILPSGADMGEYYEFTCLPTLNSSILYVDDCDGARGDNQLYIDNSFEAVLPEPPDRYDVNSPEARTSNGLGNRAKLYHLTAAYEMIIWDSGELGECTISDGTEDSDKSNDCQMLLDWMDMSTHDVELWVLGDNVGSDLSRLGSQKANQLLTECGVAVLGESYSEMSGGNATPVVTGDPSSPLYEIVLCLDLICHLLGNFDVLVPAGMGQPALTYPEIGGNPCYGGISTESTNASGFTKKTMWFGFSFNRICSADPHEPESPLPRFNVMENVCKWCGLPTNIYISDVEDVPSYAYDLGQNYPNPFNPVTSIQFTMKEKGFVTLSVYDVTGRLVKTLVNNVRDAGRHEVLWDGRDEKGFKVASGVYFCRMNADQYSDTKKLIILR